MRHGKTLPAELTLWQCEVCHRVADSPIPVSASARHLKAAEDDDTHRPWCAGRLVVYTYRLVTRSDYVLRA